MAHLRITIDGATITDGEFGEWSSEPPEVVPKILAEQRSAQPRPWMLALLPVITPALMRNQDTTISVTTRAKGWTLEVDET